MTNSENKGRRQCVTLGINLGRGHAATRRQGGGRSTWSLAFCKQTCTLKNKFFPWCWFKACHINTERTFVSTERYREHGSSSCSSSWFLTWPVSWAGGGGTSGPLGARGRSRAHLERGDRQACRFGDALLGLRMVYRQHPSVSPLHITSPGLLLEIAPQSEVIQSDSPGTGILSCWLSGNEYALEDPCLTSRVDILV